MNKTKKNFVMAPSSSDSDEHKAGDYDSMVENGTSESDEEEVPVQKVSNKESTKLKRKNDMTAPIKPVKKLKADSEKNSHLYKQPTVEEINQLKETEYIFHSNLFRMQIHEMLKETKIKEKYVTSMNSWLDEFNIFLKKLKVSSEKEPSNQLKWLKKTKLQIPIFMDNLNATNFQFNFMKITEKAVMVGSALNQTVLGPQIVCDICVTLPKQSFIKGDYLNLIYDQKRALYLTYIAWQMHSQQYPCTNIQFNYFNNNPYKPVLEIIPAGRCGKKLKFCIFVVPDPTDFKLNRFVPTNSNIRGGLFNKSVPTKNATDEIMFPTPNYNCSVLLDLTMKENAKLIDEIFSKNKNIQDGLILLKIWLTQRQLNMGFSGFGNSIMTFVVMAMYKQRKLHSAMSSYQVARNVWNYLGASEWNVNGKGLNMCTDISVANMPTLDEMHSHHDVVFIDLSGFNNICANLSLDVYLRVRFEANRAIEMLNNYNINSFQQLFMTNYPIYVQFDHIFGITNPTMIETLLKKNNEKKTAYNYAGYWFPHALNSITRVLRKGLGDRILSLNPLETITNPWDCSKSPYRQKKILKFGIVLNPEKAYENLDKGPQANESSAEEFRSFWGKKSELRRFQDGSITEACVWCPSNNILAEKRLIVKKIIEHLLQHHFNVLQVSYIANEFDVAYQVNSRLDRSKELDFNSENTSLKVIKTFDEIGRKLRSLNDLALDINGVLGTSSVFRYCDPEPILNEAFRFVAKIDKQSYFKSYKICKGTIQLGISGKWPNDLAALRHLKAAFHLQIAESLNTKFNLKTRGSIEGVYILRNGYLFCLEIGHSKEIALLKKEISIKKIVQYNDTPESIELEKRIIILPKVTSALHGLYQKFPSFGPTVMIAKRWLNGQLIDSHLWPDECTELLIASQFLKMNGLPNPCQPQTGFLRFLHMLLTTDWNTEYVLLNFNDEMLDEEKLELDNRFVTDRTSFPKLFITTSYDQKKYGIWSQNSPNEKVLVRVTLLAQYALTVLEPYISLSKSLNVSELFTASLEGYDIIIKLKDNIVPVCRAHEFDGRTRSNEKIIQKVPYAGLNPIEKALDELRAGYSDFAIFFYNQYGGKYIAVIWKPEINEVKEFKLNAVNGCQITDDNKLKFNKNAVIEDFKIILNNLYKSIELNSN